MPCVSQAAGSRVAHMQMQTIPVSEWHYVGFPEHRRAATTIVPFEEIAQFILSHGRVIDGWLEPYRCPPTPQGVKARQAIFVVAIDRPHLCDLFFNSRDGLRGRYWHLPEVGEAATKHLIGLLLPKL